MSREQTYGAYAASEAVGYEVSRTHDDTRAMELAETDATQSADAVRLHLLHWYAPIGQSTPDIDDLDQRLYARALGELRTVATAATSNAGQAMSNAAHGGSINELKAAIATCRNAIVELQTLARLSREPLWDQLAQYWERLMRDAIAELDYAAALAGAGKRTRRTLDAKAREALRERLEGAASFTTGAAGTWEG